MTTIRVILMLLLMVIFAALYFYFTRQNVEGNAVESNQGLNEEDDDD